MSLNSWLIRTENCLNVSKDASHLAAANSPVETEDSHSSVPLGQPSNEKVGAFLDEILSVVLSSKKHTIQYNSFLFMANSAWIIRVNFANDADRK